MQKKFWFFYLAFVLLLSGVAYVAISDDTNVPLALSDSEMAVLQATGADEECKDWMPGCNTTSCNPSTYSGTARSSLWIDKCMHAPGETCSQAGQWNDQRACRVEEWENHCRDKTSTYYTFAYSCR